MLKKEDSFIKQKNLRTYLSVNIKARREVLNISQEKLAELAGVSVQMISRIEGQRTWVSDKMLANLADALGVSAFQLLVPTVEAVIADNSALISSLLVNLKQNIQDEINNQFDRLISREN
jgi:transcriptional regulator with XRE-family HTH domain